MKQIPADEIKVKVMQSIKIKTVKYTVKDIGLGTLTYLTKFV